MMQINTAMRDITKEDLPKEIDKLKHEKDKLEKINKCIDAKVLELYTLYNISKTLNLSFAIEDIFGSAVDAIGKNLKIDEFNIMLIDEGFQELAVRAWYPNPIVLPNIRLKIGEGISGKTAKTGKPVVIQDLSKEPDFPFKDIITNTGSFLCLPLIGKYGDIIGVFNIHKREINSFTEDDKIFFSEVASQIGASIEKAVIFHKIKMTSTQDALTGIYNRRYFFEYLERELARAKRFKKHFSILMIDIDHFKNFNDKNGHLKGDAVLRQTANILANKLRYADTVARYGGEEFVCLLPETDNKGAMNVAEKIRKTVEETRYNGGENQPEGRLTVTIGAATYPDNADSTNELIDCADKALYQGKRAGRNRVCS